MNRRHYIIEINPAAEHERYLSAFDPIHFNSGFAYGRKIVRSEEAKRFETFEHAHEECLSYIYARIIAVDTHSGTLLPTSPSLGTRNARVEARSVAESAYQRGGLLASLNDLRDMGYRAFWNEGTSSIVLTSNDRTHAILTLRYGNFTIN